MRKRSAKFIYLFNTTIIFILQCTQPKAANLDCPWNDNSSWRYFLNRDWASIYVVIDNNAKASGEPWNNSCFKLIQERGSDNASISGYFSDWPYIYYEYTNDPQLRIPSASRWLPNFSYERTPQFALRKPEPNRYKFWAHATQFTFNEAGEIYHSRFGKVGRFLCDVPPPTTACMQGKRPNSTRYWSEVY